MAKLVPLFLVREYCESVGTLLQRHQPRRRPPRIFRPTRAGSTGCASSFRGDEGDENEMAGECSVRSTAIAGAATARRPTHLCRRSPAPTSPHEAAPQVRPRSLQVRSTWGTGKTLNEVAVLPATAIDFDRFLICVAASFLPHRCVAVHGSADGSPSVLLEFTTVCSSLLCR